MRFDDVLALPDDEARDTSEYIDALLSERMRLANGGTREDLCGECSHAALWHAPNCVACDSDQLVCRKFRQ